MLRAAGAKRVLLAHPDLLWDQSDVAAYADMSQQELVAYFEDFIHRIDATISSPGACKALCNL